MFALLALGIYFLVKLMLWAMWAAVLICAAVFYVMFVLPVKIIIGILDRA